MPPLNEGSLMYMPNTLPALSLTTQRRLLHVEDSILMTFPEVASVWGKAGRANTATDWAPMSMVETVVNLKPESRSEERRVGKECGCRWGGWHCEKKEGVGNQRYVGRVWSTTHAG